MSNGTDTVQELINRLQQEESFPAISQNISEITCKASPSGDSSAGQLAELILRDYSLTSRLLKVSNSAMYGQFSGTISTISRAVVVLGFEEVQCSAAGMIFFEHLQDKSKSEHVKEAVLSAFLSAILARNLAKNLDLDGWETFYIGAMFHNFGRLLAMYYFPEEFAVYQQLLEEGEVDEIQASRRVLGVSFNDLGIGVAKSWGLPEKIIISMELPDEKKLKKDAKKVDHHQLLPHLANELCDITINVPPQARENHLKQVLEKYQKLYPLREHEVAGMMEAAIKELKSFSEALQLDSTDLRRLDERSLKAEEISERKPTIEEPAAAPLTSLGRFEISEPAKPTEKLTLQEERKQKLQTGIQEITNVMLEDFSLDNVVGMILETIYLGIGFDRVVIFFKDPRAAQMRARFGLGANTAKILGIFSFLLNPEQNDLFNMAMRENKDLYIRDIFDTELSDFKPKWFKGHIFCPSFLLYPILIGGKPVGMIYCGYDKTGETLDTEQFNSLKTLRNQMAMAIKQSQIS
ncbi:MAG: HDOD domain-containing protein [Deltaproteobacteria bacterium]|nr:HDOD domain-containing protein [Deltaproteobacteria bacterium]